MSSYNYSYNVLINRLEAFAAGHFLIKRFTHGQIDLADQLQDDEYPFMHVVPEQIRPVDGGMQFDFLIMFADIPRDKEYKAEYQREVISDCVRLGQDLIAEVKNGLQLFGFDVQLVNTPTFEPFMEEQKNTVTGVSFTLSLEVPWDWSACDIPAIWSTGGSSTGGSGTGFGITLQTNGVNNQVQSLLNLVAGSNITITDNGDGSVTFDATGGGGGGSPYVSTEWNANHTTATGNPYQIGDRVWYNGNVYACIANNDGINPSNPAYWTLQSAGYRLRQTPVDWNASSGDYQILNKPTLATVATTGDYNDLINTPSIPSGTVTSVDLSVPSPANAALSVSGVPITSSGTIAISANGTIAQYIDGTGALKTFPTTLSAFIKGTVAGQLLQWNGSAWVTINGLALNDLTDATINTPSNGQVLTYDQASQQWVNLTPATGGTVTSVGITMPAPLNPAFSVTGSPVTTSGTLAIGANGTSAQYVDGTGALQTLPTGLPPTGTAGGDLAGTYPNPTVDGIHGIDMQSGTPNTNDVWVYGGSPAKWQHQHVNAGIVDNDSAVTGTTVKDALNHLNTTKVETTRTISTTAPLSGGGDLSVNRTLSIADAVADGSTKGAASFTASDFNSASGVISLDYTNGQKASAAQPGFLSAADWSTFNSKVGTDSVIFASNPNISQAANSTSYWAITGGAAPNATENARVVVMPCAGTLKNLYIRIGAAQSSGGTMVFTLRKNAADTAITVTFANADGSNVTKSDTANSVSVNAGDTITIKGVNNAPSSASGTFVSFSIILERS